MKHTCHWPGCTKEVPPKLWGCAPHWFRLPVFLRDAIWRHYRAGQEISKTPSAKYIAVANVVQLWCEYSQALISGQPLDHAQRLELNWRIEQEMKEMGL